jgi:hypothetical protein
MGSSLRTTNASFSVASWLLLSDGVSWVSCRDSGSQEMMIGSLFHNLNLAYVNISANVSALLADHSYVYRYICYV